MKVSIGIYIRRGSRDVYTKGCVYRTIYVQYIYNNVYEYRYVALKMFTLGLV